MSDDDELSGLEAEATLHSIWADIPADLPITSRFVQAVVSARDDETNWIDYAAVMEATLAAIVQLETELNELRDRS